MFAEAPNEKKVMLIPETENRLVGTSDETGSFSATFFKDANGQITHFMLQVGFGFWRFDKTG